MEQLHCKNCGAPIEHKYTHRCKYCNTVIFSDEEDLEELENITTDTLDANKINGGTISDSNISLDSDDSIEDGIEIHFLKSLIMAFVSLVFIFVVSNLPYIIKIIMEK